MAAEEEIEAGGGEPAARERRGWGPLRILRWVGTGLFVLVLLLAAVIAWLHTSSGRQFIVDQISKVAPASGLSVRVGRIEGSVLWSSTLYDVQLRDANNTLFLEVPEVELNWRPIKFFFTGLDVRHLVLHDGTFYAAPELIPGDPDAPMLPDFDIRVDRFIIDNMRVSEALLGEERVVDLRAQTDIRDGRVFLRAEGDLGGQDRLFALIDAEPDDERFDIELDYRAPAGGFLAGLVGAEEDLRARIRGDGGWTAWEGALVVNQGGDNLAAFKLYNQSGRYRIVGQARPGSYVEGMAAEALGEAVSLAAVGTLEDSVLRGGFAIEAAALEARGQGTIDLADNAFQGLELEAQLLDGSLMGPDMQVDDASFTATLDGPFRDLAVLHEIRVGRLNAGGTVVSNLSQEGTLLWDGTRATLPVNMQIGRINTGNAMADPRLVNGRVNGTVVYSGDRVLADDLAIRFQGLQATLAVRGDLTRGAWGVAGPVRAQGFTLDNLGTLNARADIQFRMGSTLPWQLDARFNGNMPRVTNATLANVAGDNIRFSGGVSLGATRPIVARNVRLQASKLTFAMNGRMDGSNATLTGQGNHVDYGDFTVEAQLADDGPRAVLVLAEPLPAAGLRDVRVALAPSEDGFFIETEGQSMLGPFDGELELVMPEDGPIRIDIARLDVFRTSVTGNLVMVDAGIEGQLALAGGGVDGTIALAPREGGQGFDVALEAQEARFAGPTPLNIRQASIDATGVFGGEQGTTVSGNLRAAGISYGQFFLGRIAAQAQMADGRGTFDASFYGRRGSRFNLDITGSAQPDRIAVAARGEYGGQPISMPRRAVLVATEDGGWELQRTQLGFGGGIAIAEGRYGGEGDISGQVSLSDLPLALTDLFAGDMGLGGTISGVVDVQANVGELPTGEARIMVDGLTRSGLVLTSRPINLALVARLSATQLQARAVIEDERDTRGRLQARIANLPQDGALMERLFAGDLFAQLRYEGPAASLWRLAAIDLIDIRGRLSAAADVTGTLAEPQVRGSLSGNSLRIQSALTGTDITQVRARGRFSGSRLQLTSFAGNAPNGGTVSGSGFVDLGGMSADRGPQIDLRMAARNAEIMDLANMGATVTGPMRIVSNGNGGAIAGRLRVNGARWALGIAEESTQLPDIATREINLPLDYAPPSAQSAPWRYMIDATAPGGIEVDGMGLDSEWRGEVRLRGTTDDPRIGGQVQVVPRQGFYSFAGVRFDLTRGQIDFDESEAINPRIDILAETDVDDLSVAVEITGTATQPIISFNSTPSLPEEELLARLLFGGSISDLSATDALQLGAAIASLQGGGGMGPINQLRSAIGLDRLRLLPADPALDRGTSVALGKNIGRRFYGEVITDGANYNATEVEFRVTSWLSLLGSISSLGRNTAAVEYSRDY